MPIFRLINLFEYLCPFIVKQQSFIPEMHKVSLAIIVFV